MTRPDWWRASRAPFTATVLADALAHANREAPKESCGLVIAGAYAPCENVSPAPEEAFEIAPAVRRAAFASGGIEGVVHSHPGGPWYPSAADMASQIDTDVPWAIVVPGEPGELACIWGDARPPLYAEGGGLLPRAFCHGVSDCYTLVRDWYAQRRGVELPEFPRDWEWWDDGASLYLDGFASAGFELVTSDAIEIRTGRSLEVGDVVLRSVRSKTPNHACVYEGGSLVIEHFPKRLAARRPWGVASLGATHLLRYRGASA